MSLPMKYNFGARVGTKVMDCYRWQVLTFMACVEDWSNVLSVVLSSIVSLSHVQQPQDNQHHRHTYFTRANYLI